MLSKFQDWIEKYKEQSLIASASTRKADIKARVFRVATGKWEDLGIVAHPEEYNPLIKLFKKHILGWHFATVLTDAGEAWIVDKLDETSQLTGDFVGWGTGAGTAAKGDTTLFTEAAESRVSGTRTQPSADKIRWVATITSASGQTITNAGNFDASTSGNLIVHGDFTGIVLSNGDKIEFTIDLEIT